jgi:FdhE protein
MNAIVRPGDIVTPDKPAALKRAPLRVFAERAQRFEQLAQGHPLGPYLTFMARVVSAQQALLEADDLCFAAADRDLALRLSGEGKPPLSVACWPRARPWQQGLRRLLAVVVAQAPAPTRQVIDRLVAADADSLEQMAERALHGAHGMRDPIADPLLAAALQAYWVGLAAAIDTEGITLGQTTRLCPVCGSAPVASVVHGTGAEHGVRYLHCGLCESEWQLARIRCSHCDNEKGIVYFGAEGRDWPVRAEVCEQCHSYLKVVHRDKDALADPIADDLASLDLDLALAAEGYARSGPNLLFVPGEEMIN